MIKISSWVLVFSFLSFSPSATETQKAEPKKPAPKPVQAPNAATPPPSKKPKPPLPRLISLPKAAKAPTIESLLKKEVMKKVLKKRVVITHASLDDEPGRTYQNKPLKRYRYYASMLVRASSRMTREVLTTYELYGKLIPFVDKIELSKKENILNVEGGIWKYRFKSAMHLLHQAENWIRFKVISGHFRGMTGNIYFESRGEKGTLVYLGGGALGFNWPPALVMERGAEIVFDTAGKRMRSFIEDKKRAGREEHRDEQKDGSIPKPRNRI